jgi:hypothetical protein
MPHANAEWAQVQVQSRMVITSSRITRRRV